MARRDAESSAASASNLQFVLDQFEAQQARDARDAALAAAAETEAAVAHAVQRSAADAEQKCARRTASLVHDLEQSEKKLQSVEKKMAAKVLEAAQLSKAYERAAEQLRESKNSDLVDRELVK